MRWREFERTEREENSISNESFADEYRQLDKPRHFEIVTIQLLRCILHEYTRTFNKLANRRYEDKRL